MKDEVNPRLQRWEDRTELPLLVASLVFLAGYATHVLAPGKGFWPDLGYAALRLCLDRTEAPGGAEAWDGQPLG